MFVYYFVMYIRATAALHRILKCYHFRMTTVRVFVHIISIPNGELFSETTVECTVS